MPQIPVTSPLGYVGVAILLLGLFLIIAGLGIIEIKQVTVRRGTKTWVLGFVLAATGSIFLLLQNSSESNPVATPTATMTASATTNVPTQTTSTSTLSTSENLLSGTWQGTDSYDDSTIILLLIQKGNQISGTYSDSYSLNINPPGFQGSGSGVVLSPTAAHMAFNLSRWDGKNLTIELNLIFSNQDNTLMISDGIYKTVLQKQ